MAAGITGLSAIDRSLEMDLPDILKMSVEECVDGQQAPVWRVWKCRSCSDNQIGPRVRSIRC